jgi:hypothetical protein
VRTRSAQLTLTLVFVILGALVMIQFRTQDRLASAKVAESASDQTTIIANLANANDELRRESQSLAQQEAEYRRTLAEDDLTGPLADLGRLRVITGETEVSGPGIELRVSYPIRAEEVQDVVNEFRNAGAEALAVNGIRVVAMEPGGVLLDKPKSGSQGRSIQPNMTVSGRYFRFRSRANLGREMEPFDVGRMAVLLASDDCALISGCEITMDGADMLY